MRKFENQNLYSLGNYQIIKLANYQINQLYSRHDKRPIQKFEVKGRRPEEVSLTLPENYRR